MLAQAKQFNIPVSSRKANLVCALIRNKPVNEAIKILEHTPQKTSKFLKKLVSSALANAVTNHNMIGEKLYIFSCVANQGPTLKRTMPRAKGSSTLIRKRTTHLIVQLSDDPKFREKINKYLLKPRAHQHKYKTDLKQAIKVETQMVNQTPRK